VLPSCPSGETHPKTPEQHKHCPKLNNGTRGHSSDYVCRLQTSTDSAAAGEEAAQARAK
jgi:hypothetical protein